MCVTENSFNDFNWFFLNFSHNFSSFISNHVMNYSYKLIIKSNDSLYSKNCHKCSGCYRCTDNSGNVWSHRMHQ